MLWTVLLSEGGRIGREVMRSLTQGLETAAPTPIDDVEEYPLLRSLNTSHSFVTVDLDISQVVLVLISLCFIFLLTSHQ